LEGTLVAPDPPSDTSDAIGEGDGGGGDVVASGLCGPNGPGLELIEFGGAVSCEESGSGTVDKEHASVGVAALGDSAESTAEA
jgi:hypothetical protein